ncbi:MAG: hypothetical protein ACYC8S_00580 [Minisyncoccota bacterium]
MKKNGTAIGSILIYLLVIITIFPLMVFPVMGTIATQFKLLRVKTASEGALQIAEAGVNYYQWHLAHYPTDYQDGTGAGGPYVHTYIDADTQQPAGTYSLMITPPPLGSTIVTITSTGWTASNPSVTRTVTARYGVPSLAKYAFASNDVIWIGNNETVGGEMQSNNGIRFDGVGNAPIESAKSTYTCPGSQGSPCPTTQNGVWGSASQSTKNFWQFPVPALDFSSLTANLASLKSMSQSGGIYLPPSNKSGYSLVFNSNGTVSVYKVTSLYSTPTGWDVNGNPHNEDIDYRNRTLQFTQALPSNGIIYIEDKTWVEGVVHGRVMVAAATLPYNASTAPTIYLPNNIVYSAKDGSDSLGLLAQQDAVVTYRAPTNLEVDAAIITQNGSAQFFYFPSTVKNSITVYGSIMSYGQWTWTWVDQNNNVVSGYQTTVDNYDANLLYGPPPSFPLSSAGYRQISWTSN